MSKIKIVNLANYLLPATLLWLGFVLVCLIFFVSKNIGETHLATGINQQINYQGRLLTNTGAVVPDGSYNVEFKIYQDGDGVIGGGDETLEWTETRTGGNKVLVKNGYFSVYLGAITPFGSSVDWNQDTLWLSVNIGGTGSPSWDGEMSPFTRFSSTPYALNSKALNGLESSNFVQLAQGTQTDASTTDASISINKTGGTANILDLMRGGTSVLSIANNGSTIFKNQADSTTAFQIQNSVNDPLLVADTTNMRVNIGENGTATSQLYVSGSLPSATTLGAYANFGTNAYASAMQGDQLYVIDHSSGSLEIYNTSNPESTTYLGEVYLGGNPLYIHVDGRYAYVVNLNDTMDVIDISNPYAPAQVSSVATGVDPFGVYVQGKYAYVTNRGDDTIEVIDISDPANPISFGGVSTGDGPVYVTVQGRYAYVASLLGDTFDVFDLSDPAAPFFAGNVLVGDGPVSIEVKGKYAYVANYTGASLQTLDISDPANPVVLDTVSTGTQPVSVKIQGRYAYVLNRSGATIQTFDVSDPTDIALVGSVATNGTVPRSIQIKGRYAFVSSYDSTISLLTQIESIDLGGSYIQQLEVGNIQTSSILSNGNLDISGNATIGTGLTVAGSSYLQSDTSVSGDLTVAGDVLFKTIGSTTAFQIQDFLGTSNLFIADTVDNRVGIGAIPANGLLTIGTATTAASGGLYFGTDANLYRGGANTLQTDDQLLIKTTSNSINAFRVQDSSGANVLQVSTGAGNKTVYVGGTGANGNLYVNDTNASPLFYFESASNGTFGVSADFYEFQSFAATPMLSLDGTTENVGIGLGVGAANYKLDVDGEVNSSGYRLNGTAGLSSTCSGGQFLQNQVATGGLTMSGTCANAVTTVGLLGGSIANGASISANTITLGSADTSNPGLVTTGSQTFGGYKTFDAGARVNNSGLFVRNLATDGFRVQTTFSVNLLNVDTSGNVITIGSSATDALVLNSEIRGASPLTFEGATNDDVRTTFDISDPSVARTITFPNATGYVVLDSQFNGDATVSSSGLVTIQPGVVSNSKLANSSISLALGTSGTDINWGAGTVSLGGTATLNLPDASTSARGLVTTGTQTFGGDKTFQNDLDVRGNTTLGNNSQDTVTSIANIKGAVINQGVTGTTTGTGTNTTTLTLTSDAFSVNDVVLIDNAGQDYYTRITVDPGTGSYTVSPAVTFESGRTVTKYNVQNLGATQSDYSTLSDRFFQGYFLGGVVTGAGTTSLSDGLLYSSGALNINASSVNFNSNLDLANNLLINIGNAGTDFTAGGGLTLAGALSGTTGSFSGAIAANGGITFDNATDTLSAFTLAGTQDAGNNLILNIGNSGTDFTSGGGLNVAGALAANGGLTVQPASAGTVGATITARTAQTADLFRIVDEFGDNLVTVNPNVGFTIKSSDGFTSSNAFSVVKLDTTETIIIGVNSSTPGLYTESTSFNLINTTATTLNIGGAAGAGGINFAGGYGSTGCSIDGSNGNLSCNGSLTLGAGLSATTGTFSGALAANGGITFDNATDTIGAFTLAGTLDANSNLITNIGNAGTDFVSGGGLTLAGTLTGNGVVSLGDGGDTFAINSTAFVVSTAGAVSGVTTLSASGEITTSGNFDVTGSGVYQIDNVSGATITCGSNNYLSNIVLNGGIITGNNGCRSIGLSDARVKNNVVELEQGILDQIKNVRAVTFDFDCDHELFTTTSLGCETAHQTGVIAQELAQVFPGLVRMEDDGYYRVDYNALSVYNLKAVTEIAQFINSDGEASFSNLSALDLKTDNIGSLSGSALHIDGDLVIDGELIAKSVKAESVEGLDILTNRIGRLESDLSSSGGDSRDESASIFGSLLADSIQTDSLEVSFDLSVGGTVSISEGLTVAGLTTFDGEVVFNRVARFADEAIFGKSVTFSDHVTFGDDNGGYAIVSQGQKELRVEFKKEYQKDPVVNLNIKNGQFVDYAYKDLDKKGFTIVLKETSDQDIEFSWTAFEIDSPRTITGIPNQEDSDGQN